MNDLTQGPCQDHAARWGWRPGIPTLPWLKRAEELSRSLPVVLFHEHGTLATHDGRSWISADGQRFDRLVDALCPIGLRLPSLEGEGAREAEAVRVGLVLASRHYRAKSAGLAYDDAFRDFLRVVLRDYLAPRLGRTQSDWWLRRRSMNWSRRIGLAMLRRRGIA